MAEPALFTVCRFCGGYIYGDGRDDTAHTDCCKLCVQEAREQLRSFQEVSHGDPP